MSCSNRPELGHAKLISVSHLFHYCISCAGATSLVKKAGSQYAIHTSVAMCGGTFEYKSILF